MDHLALRQTLRFTGIVGKRIENFDIFIFPKRDSKYDRTLRRFTTSTGSCRMAKRQRQNNTEFFIRFLKPRLASNRWGRGGFNNVMGDRSKATHATQGIAIAQWSVVELFTPRASCTQLTSTNRIPSSEFAIIDRIFDRSRGTGTQTPLYASIMISPMMLLLPNSLASMRWAKKRLLQVGICVQCQ